MWDFLATLLTGGASAITGSIVGAITRFVPEFFKLFTLKKDQDHEYRMTQLQLQIDQARAQQDIDKVHANEALESVRGEMAAYLEALKGQSQMTGVPWIDGLNQSVRPFITYWWMFLLTLYKATVLVSATSYNEFMSKIWTDDDVAMLSMILGFWFVDRAIKKKR